MVFSSVPWGSGAVLTRKRNLLSRQHRKLIQVRRCRSPSLQATHKRTQASNALTHSSRCRSICTHQCCSIQTVTRTRCSSDDLGFLLVGSRLPLLGLHAKVEHMQQLTEYGFQILI